MIDWDFEARLIDRIAAREAIAARLTPRQRQVMVRYVRYGETFEEVGKHEGCGRGRIGQIVNRSLEKLQEAFVERPTARPARPQQTTRATPPPGFDKAAFLDHMLGVIQRKSDEALELFARERQALDNLLRKEAGQLPPKPGWNTPPLYYQLGYAPPKPKLQIVYPAQQYAFKAPNPQPLTASELGHIAKEAVAALTLLLGPKPVAGSVKLGAMNNSATYQRNACSIGIALRGLLDSLPPDAKVSACLFPTSWPGVCAANGTVAVNVMSSIDGTTLQFDISWDEA